MKLTNTCGGGNPGKAPARLTAGLVLACLLAPGCDQLTHRQQQQQAEQHWNEVRAQVKHQLAAQQLQAGQVEDSVTTAQDALGLNPASVESYLLLCRALLEKGDLAAARRVLDTAEQMGVESAELAYMRGVIAERSRRLSDALEHYQRARALDPTDRDYLMAVAECLVALGSPEQARDRVLEAVDQFDRDGTLDTLVAEISMLLGDDEAAAAAFRRAMPLLGEHDLIAEEYGLLLVRMGRLTEAVSVLQPLAERRGREVSGLVTRGLARCYLELGHAELADTILGRRLRQCPEDATAWLLRARVAVARGDLPLIHRCAAEARRLAPGHPETHILHGYVCWRQGRLEEALRSLERSLQVSPDDVLAHCLIGQVLAEAGDARTAGAHWRRALQINPRSRWASAALNRLTEDPPAVGAAPQTGVSRTETADPPAGLAARTCREPWSRGPG